ncbi:riboflavin kinase/FMN adenylyltransferase [Rubricella aquisinus]|uniref:Riboflavin biosynthesis protein n=1 Tax=Rubricella aquisinus TaxID=2028108 RepID=A0A840WWL4_9RHOB|nr:bifunctional riboflavin kinase/FAD synthetase [Rubricella aquisinus]MBB5514096.1 riboflavin kinase/FMN adenylyltransferase [Rubricella aquisinus]
MQVFHDTQVPLGSQGASVAMGNFDGVHLGHRSVIDLARRDGAPLGVITFEPHPRSYFAPHSAPFRLMNSTTRLHRLDKLGVDVVYELPFDAALAGLSPEAFGGQILRDGLGIRHLVVGTDFRFGKGRAGDVDTLRQLGGEMGFDVTAAPLLTEGDAPVSSTAIRAALSDGDPARAAAMLGHWHRIDGPVEHGFKRGRELGFPTANISMEGLHLPRFGIYAVLVDVLDGPHQGSYHGCASLGSRPTFGDHAPNLEVFLMDFSGDLYGAQMSTALVAFQRPELKFDGIDPLIAQMGQDVQQARKILTDP